MTEVLQIGFGKNTLRSTKVEGALCEGVEDCFQVLNVVCPRIVVDQYIVEEDRNEFAQEWSEQFVHRGLEGGRRVAEPKGHHTVLIMAGVGAEGYFGDVFFGHPNLMGSLA